MRVLYASAELAPLVRVGGLGEVAGGLVKALRAAGVEVDVVVPDYSGVLLESEQRVALDMPEWTGPSRARNGVLPGYGPITLVQLAGIARPHPYVDPATGIGWPDNDQRFMGFSAAVAALARGTSPDVVHLNDWHTGAVLAMGVGRIPSVLSLHNLAYQGQCHLGWLAALDDRQAAFARDGSCNPLAGAIRLADAIVAVSPTYATEILSANSGCGLDEILRDRGEAVRGILNGIDTNEWDPSADPALEVTYSLADVQADGFPQKDQGRVALRREMGLSATDPRTGRAHFGPVVGLVSRLVDQKGVDLAVALVPFLESIDAQLVVLGSGDPGLSAELAELSKSSARVAFREGYDLGLSHRIFAGADLYLMPSRFEPCGLAQMQAMAYGTIPVVTDVGGLHDTVIDVDEDPARGVGFVARTLDVAGLVDALHRATRAWSNTRLRMEIIRRGMRTDWSWVGPANDHMQLYEQVIASSRR